MRGNISMVEVRAKAERNSLPAEIQIGRVCIAGPDEGICHAAQVLPGVLSLGSRDELQVHWTASVGSAGDHVIKKL
jgi:hypothetical protein